MTTLNRPKIPEALGIVHKILVLDDEPWEDLLSILSEACEFIDQAIGERSEDDGKVEKARECETRAEGLQTEQDGDENKGKTRTNDVHDGSIPIPTHVEQDSPTVQKGNRILIHCLQGISRSGAVLIAYLMRRLALSYTTARDMARVYRPVVTPNDGFAAQLELWDSMGYDLYVEEDRNSTKELAKSVEEGENGYSQRKEKQQYLEWKRRRDETKMRSEEEWNRERVRGVVGVVARMGRLRKERLEGREGDRESG